MKIYGINDDESGLSVGTLLYYEKERSCVIELQEGLDEWTAPLLFTGYVREGIYTIPRDVSYLWVKERVIPHSRQNIGSILSHHRMKSYDEMRFLEISGGRCSQDSLSVRQLEQVPEYVEQRMRYNLCECITLKGYTLLCFFADDTVRKVDLSLLDKAKDMDKVIGNEALFESCSIGSGGYAAVFNDAIDVPAWLLYSSGVSVPLTTDDFAVFVRKNIADTAESCDILQCSRQNLSYLVKKGHLSPVKKDVKGNLYLKGDVISNRW